MRTSARFGFRIAAIAVFGVTAVVAVTLTRGVPMHAALISARHNPAPARETVTVPRCVTSDLRITIGAGSPAARSYPLDFTNVSGASCTLSGYPAVAAYRGNHVEVGNPAAPDTATPDTGAQAAPAAPGGATALNAEAPAQRVLLVPGATARTAVAVSAGLPSGTCRPVVAAGLRVVPPGESVPRYLQHPLPACSAAGPRAPVFLRVRVIQPDTP